MVDEIFGQLKAFRAGVRVFVLSDSRHSGSVVFALPPKSASQERWLKRRTRALPDGVGEQVLDAHRAV